MKRKNYLHVLAMIWLLPLSALGQWSLDVESGLVFPGYNDVRIPNETGTLFSVRDDFEIQGLVIPLRIKIGVSFGDNRNHISGLFAPLSIRYEGDAPFDIRFQDTDFDQGDFIDGLYKFNSYRLTYRRNFLLTENWVVGAGITAKIRDASVRLRTEEQSDTKDDLGFVPLLNVFLAYERERFNVWFEGDALAGGPGRAFDFFLGASTPIRDMIRVKTGYRFLEGGADTGEVYNFTLLHFLSLGLLLEF